MSLNKYVDKETAFRFFLLLTKKVKKYKKIWLQKASMDY
jgi:hypothetical protein